MVLDLREKNIELIIELEDRISKCHRCPNLLKCVSKPSTGKGHLQPEVLLVFENDNQFTMDMKKIVALYNLIKKELNVNNIYHTFMVRCQPKVCTIQQNVKHYIPEKCIDKDNTCLINNKPCTGIEVKASSEEIILCLSFLLEEIEILQPKILILFGDRVAEFLLKSYGIYDYRTINQFFKYQQKKILITVEESKFKSSICKELFSLVHCY